MVKIKRSPFKVNIVENNPHAFGLRYKEIIASLDALYNNRSIVISGQRGIGKSSMGCQLQNVLEGDNTLLTRCGIEVNFPKTLCVFYACDPNITLDQLVLDILHILEQKIIAIPKIGFNSTSIEFNLGVIKAKFEGNVSTRKRSPATYATLFVDGLYQIQMSLMNIHFYESINIMLDELDLLSSDINFGHFIKIVHETLIRKELFNVSFIFAGQKGIYPRLIEQDKSFERIVHHISLSILDADASTHVLQYASSQVKPTFRYDGDALGLLLSISSGYPYVLHFLGDAAYMTMEIDSVMSKNDVITGISNVLQSDKREKYLSIIDGLTNTEYLIIFALSQYAPDSLPAQIQLTWLKKKVRDFVVDPSEVENVLSSLEEKGHIKIFNDQDYCIFSEELFRVFVSMIRIKTRETQIRKQFNKPEQKIKERFAVEEEIMRMVIAGELGDIESFGELNSKERENILEEIKENLTGLTYTTGWEDDDIFETYEKDFFDED